MESVAGDENDEHFRMNFQLMIRQFNFNSILEHFLKMIDKVSRHVQLWLLLLSTYFSLYSIWLISDLLHL
jgi:hypothetical protein